MQDGLDFGIIHASCLSIFQSLAPDLYGMLVRGKPVGKRATQFFVALRQRAQVFVRVFNRFQA
jgi:hypothetical protein